MDSIFSRPGPIPTPDPEWAQIQNRLVTSDRWIIDDGDLGPYDTNLALRLSAADTITQTIAAHAKHANVFTLHNPSEVRRFLDAAAPE